MKTTTSHLFKAFIILTSILCFSIGVNGQNKKSWTSNDLFEKRLFIENLGQFDEIVLDESTKILFHGYSKGTNFYFTNKGVVFEGKALVKRSRKEIKQILRAKESQSQKNGFKNNLSREAYEEHEDNEKMELAYKEGSFYEQMQWDKANPTIKVTAKEEVNSRYLFGDKVTHETISCRGFKALTYHDVYPNIDVEFYFPKDSSGFKYNYIVKPGGNPSLISEKWLNTQSIQLNTQGDISISAPFGTINSKKPYSFCPTKNNALSTSYVVKGNLVSYNLDEKTDDLLIIDPWTTVTTLGATFNKGYDVDYDNYGNSYVYGGPSPFTLQKYDPSGALVWSYVTTLFGSTPTYGDFVVDKNTGRSYIVSAFSSSTSLIKLSSSGAFVDDFADISISEMWRIIYDTTSNHLIIGVGLTTDQLVYLDTALTTFTVHNAIGPTAYATDVVFLATDNYSNCYFLYSYWSPSLYVNEIIKVPVSSLSTITYHVPSDHYFLEALSPKYGPATIYFNGYNGMAIAGNNMFTYDSYKVKKRTISTGALLISKAKNMPIAGDSSHMYWGGLAVDQCNSDVFIGSRDTVFQYDSMLVLKNTFPMAGIVIDIQVAEGIVYVSGDGFVSAFEIAPCGCTTVNPGTVVTNVTCNGLSDGSITLSPSGGVLPYTYDWGALPFTDSIATGLAAGNYSLTLSDSAGCSQNLVINVPQPSALNISVNPDTVNCFGNTALLVCVPTGGTGPYTVLWNTSLPVLNDTLAIASPGVYSITITDATGCSANFTHTLYEPAQLTATLVSNDVSCDGTVLGNMTANVVGGTGPYNYTWSNDPSNNTNVNTALTAGIYDLTITDDNGCTIGFTDTITQLLPPAISFVNVQPCYNGNNGTITATSTGGTAGVTFTYTWNTVPAQTGLIANNVSAGSYILSVEANGCTFTFPVVLNENAIIDTLKINGVICGLDNFVTLYLPEQAMPIYNWYNAGVLMPTETGSTYNSSITDAPFISASWFMVGCNYVTTTVETNEYPVAAVKSIPNVFSPNDDGLNNLFYAFTFIGSTDPSTIDFLFEDFTFQVFNRWGQLVFETNEPTKAWDGKDGSGDVSEGVYFVVVRFKALCADSKDEVIYNGTVQLVR